MGNCLGMWFLPLVSGDSKHGRVCDVEGSIKSVDCYSKAGIDSTFWFLRKKMGLSYCCRSRVIAGSFQAYSYDCARLNE